MTSSSFEMFKKQIDEAVEIIEKADVVEKKDVSEMRAEDSMVDTQSLLERCEAFCIDNADKKPTIRIIHHLACSGGTLISKCLAAMPNVFLLSEIHPFSTLHMSAKKPGFSPCDFVSLARHANIPHIDELAANQFLSSVRMTNQHVSKYGGTLILRDHCHSDFCIGKQYQKEGAIHTLVKNDFNILSAITIRNPIDCYMSLIKNNWRHFEPFTFDEYCKRVLSFLKAYPHVHVFKYEDFVDSPMQVLEKICLEIELPFSEYFEHIFDVFSVTGDSGRKSSDIKQRERSPINEALKNDIENSENFKIINKMLGY